MLASLGLALAVLLLSFIEETVATRRTQAIQRHAAHPAGAWSALFDALLYFDVIVVVATQKWWLVVPVCVGSYAGNWWAVKHRPKRRKVRRRRVYTKARAR